MKLEEARVQADQLFVEAKNSKCGNAKQFIEIEDQISDCKKLIVELQTILKTAKPEEVHGIEKTINRINSAIVFLSKSGNQFFFVSDELKKRLEEIESCRKVRDQNRAQGKK